MSPLPNIEPPPSRRERAIFAGFRLAQLLVLLLFARFLFSLNWELITKHGSLLLKGLLLTIELTIISLAIGFVIALPLALLRAKGKRRFLAWAAKIYVAIFRGSPLLVQVFLIYYGLGGIEAVRESFLWPVLREAHYCVLIAFALNSGAYACEIFRGALLGSAMGEREAARALGLREWQVDWLIWVPSALRRSLPQYGNEMVFMLHGTSVAGLVTLSDIFGAAKEINSRYYTFYEGMIPAALLYIALTFLVVALGRALEARFLRHLNR